eukprot:TRINITY_DN31708_c0_g1_i1.p1 TRINITY_DN31708_c0_g1~~TRINITY_DN31708_c0_g1_i1.p1  ORF type:complete len:670 (-),score=60.01 TRINITY_DN31708_c0_g1_i1:53-2062(-)
MQGGYSSSRCRVMSSKRSRTNGTKSAKTDASEEAKKCSLRCDSEKFASTRAARIDILRAAAVLGVFVALGTASLSLDGGSVAAAVDAARLDLVARRETLTDAVSTALSDMAARGGNLTAAVEATVEVVLHEIQSKNLTAAVDAARVELAATRSAAGIVALAACLLYIWLALLVDIVLTILWLIPRSDPDCPDRLKQRLSLARTGANLCLCHEVMWSRDVLEIQALREILATQVPGLGGDRWRDPQKTHVQLALPAEHDSACCFFALDLGFTNGDVVANGPRRLFICPRGSYNSTDWLADFEFASEQPPWIESIVDWIVSQRRKEDQHILSGVTPYSLDAKRRKLSSLDRQAKQLALIRTHRGFGDWYMKFRYTFWEVIDSWVAEYGQFDEVFFCGHSLGAATATLAALDYALTLEVRSANCSHPTPVVPAPDLRVVTFGSPRVGNLQFRRAFNARCPSSSLLQCQLDHDVVSFLPHMWVGLVRKKRLWAAFGVQLILRYFTLDFCRRFTLSANVGSATLTVNVRKIEELWIYLAAVELFGFILLFLFPGLGTVLSHVFGADSFWHVGRVSNSMLLVFESGEAHVGMSDAVFQCHCFQWILGVLQGGKSFTQHYLARYISSIEQACVSARSPRSWTWQLMKTLAVVLMIVLGALIYYPVVTHAWHQVMKL